jgi:orotate phosphoribosyltransferase
MKEDLVRMLYEHAFKWSDTPIFKLTSGKTSKFYVDCKMVTLSPMGMWLVGKLVYNEVKDYDIVGVGGLTFGADPVSIATALVSGISEKPVQAFSIRKTLKGHGTGKWVEGSVKPGDNVVIVDDVSTTGRSTIEAIERSHEYGLNVKKVVILLDREEGGVNSIKKYVSDVSVITTLDDIKNYGRIEV